MDYIVTYMANVVCYVAHTMHGFINRAQYILVVASQLDQLVSAEGSSSSMLGTCADAARPLNPP